MIRKILTVIVIITILLSLSSCDTLNTTGNTGQNSNLALNTVQSILNNGTQEAFQFLATPMNL